MKSLLLPCLLLALTCRAGAAPVVLWVSDPVLPGQTVLAFGAGMDRCRSVRWERLSDAAPGRAASGVAAPLQVRPRSVKFLLPSNVAPGVFRATVATAVGETAFWINRPQILWAQGDQGLSASPGGWVRVVGRCLSWGSGRPMLRLSGAGRVFLLKPTRSEAFTQESTLPASLPAGAYQIATHSGAGGPDAWSEPVAFRVVARPPPPTRVFAVSPAASEADEDTEAIRKALAEAGIGGGIVALSAGRYLLNGALSIPPHVLLRGAGMARTALCWEDTETPPPALIRGQDHFGVEDLSLYAANYAAGIVADQDTPTAGHVRLARVRLRLNPYRSHLTPEEVNRRFLEAQKLSSGGGDSLRLGGRDVEVANCDVYGAGRCLYLSRGAGVWIHDNQFFNGRWGWYCLSGNDGVLFERNSITGGDLMSTGGGLNCLDGSNVSQNVFFADNTLRNMFGWDREAMTTDAGGGAYYGRVTSSGGAALTLASDPKWGGRDWTGAGVFILDGSGQGQYRQIVRTDGRRVTLDRPWVVAPGADSVVTVTMLQRNYLFVRNSFADAGVAIQLYGTSIGAIASGNVSARTDGFHNFGMNYDGIQPSWFTQWLGNEITEGNVYGGGHDQSVSVGEAHLAVQALPPRDMIPAALTLCSVVRGNRLDGDAHLEIGAEPADSGLTFPYVQEVVVEGNRVQNAQFGLRVSRTASGVLARANVFISCSAGVVDEEQIERAARAQRQALYALPGPLLRLDFSRAQAGTIPDATGHGFTAHCQGVCRVTPAGPRGPALILDGTSFLRVSHPELIGMDSFTLSAWVESDHLKGRWGFLSKRIRGGAAPFILGEEDGRLFFEATDTQGLWSFNVRSLPVLTPGVWHHVAAVMHAGEGVILYADGVEVARRLSPAALSQNDEPLCIGRESWGGDPAGTTGPALLSGRLADVQIWPRALSPAEVAHLMAFS